MVSGWTSVLHFQPKICISQHAICIDHRWHGRSKRMLNAPYRCACASLHPPRLRFAPTALGSKRTTQSSLCRFTASPPCTPSIDAPGALSTAKFGFKKLSMYAEFVATLKLSIPGGVLGTVGFSHAAAVFRQQGSSGEPSVLRMLILNMVNQRAFWPLFSTSAISSGLRP